MKKLALLMIPVSFSAFGGEASISGKAMEYVNPDVVEVSLQVNSVCYKTPKEATEATDKVVKSIYEFLVGKLPQQDAKNRVISKGGYTQAYQRYIQGPDRKSQIVCQNTYQKNTNVTVRTSDINGFENLFNELQQKVASEYYRENPHQTHSPLTHVTLNQPHAYISEELNLELEKKLMKSALDNAKAKLFSTFGETKPMNLSITRISETKDSNVPRPLQKTQFQERGAMMMAAESAPPTTPIAFDVSKFSKTLYVDFSFDNLPVN